MKQCETRIAVTWVFSLSESWEIWMNFSQLTSMSLSLLVCVIFALLAHSLTRCYTKVFWKLRRDHHSSNKISIQLSVISRNWLIVFFYSVLISSCLVWAYYNNEERQILVKTSSTQIITWISTIKKFMKISRTRIYGEPEPYGAHELLFLFNRKCLVKTKIYLCPLFHLFPRFPWQK